MICVHSRVVKSIDYKDYRQYHSVVIRPEVHHIAKARASEVPAAEGHFVSKAVDYCPVESAV